MSLSGRGCSAFLLLLGGAMQAIARSSQTGMLRRRYSIHAFCGWPGMLDRSIYYCTFRHKRQNIESVHRILIATWSKEQRSKSWFPNEHVTGQPGRSVVCCRSLMMFSAASCVIRFMLACGSFFGVTVGRSFVSGVGIAVGVGVGITGDFGRCAECKHNL